MCDSTNGISLKTEIRTKVFKCAYRSRKPVALFGDFKIKFVDINRYGSLNDVYCKFIYPYLADKILY